MVKAWNWVGGREKEIANIGRNKVHSVTVGVTD